MSDTIWRVSFKGSEYTVSDRDLTVTRLRQMKQMYGREYGAYSGFITLLAQGDVDAIACGLWIAKQVAGEPRAPKSPNDVDFTMGDIEFLPIEQQKDDEEERPTQPATAPPTPVSTATAPTSSDSSTSSDSPTSAE